MDFYDKAKVINYQTKSTHLIIKLPTQERYVYISNGTGLHKISQILPVNGEKS